MQRRTTARIQANTKRKATTQSTFVDMSFIQPAAQQNVCFQHLRQADVIRADHHQYVRRYLRSVLRLISEHEVPETKQPRSYFSLVQD
jgi:hypothetical protein